MTNKKDNLEIQEIFMAKAGKQGWDRCLYGTIQRGLDSDGSPVVRGKIKVKNGFIHAMVAKQDELGERLDELDLMVLDEGLHDDTGNTSTIVGMLFCPN
jgi:hypothetical protein